MEESRLFYSLSHKYFSIRYRSVTMEEWESFLRYKKDVNPTYIHHPIVQQIKLMLLKRAVLPTPIILKEVIIC